MEITLTFCTVMCLVAFCTALYLIIKLSNVVLEHKAEIEKNRAAIQLLSKRLDDVASMVALCPDDINPVDYCPDDVNIFGFEEVENNEQ